MFSKTIPGHWETKFDEGTIVELINLFELRSLKLHVQEVRKRGNKVKTGDNDYKISDFDTQKSEILEELKKQKTMILKI